MMKSPKIHVEKKHRKFLPLILMFFLLLFGGIVVLTQINRFFERQISDLSATLNYLKSETHFASLGIQSMQDSIIHFTLSFFSPEGEKVYSQNFSLKGSDIYLESRVLILKNTKDSKNKPKTKLNTRALIFPLRVYSDEIPPTQGLSLTNLYHPITAPLLYASTSAPNKQKINTQLLALSKFALGQTNKVRLNKNLIKNSFETSLHIGPFKQDQAHHTYDFIIHPNGAVEMLEKE